MLYAGRLHHGNVTRESSDTSECYAALAGRVQRIVRPKARLEVDDGVLVVFP